MPDMLQLLKDGIDRLNIGYTDNQLNSLIKYYEILIERNKVLNLTRITEPTDVVTKHFLDSMTPILTGHISGRVIDVGTGAGFPGLVLKCMLPQIDLTLLDSLNKRISFLKDAKEYMGIDDGVSFIHSRAEDAGLSKEHREKYDTVVSRAVANMRTLSEWCLPLIKEGGYFLALKGPLADDELEDAKPAIEILGGEVTDVFTASIPYTDLRHKIIIVKKVRPTPTFLPRKGKKATQEPVEKIRRK